MNQAHHLDAIAGMFQSAVNKMVVELRNVATETQLEDEFDAKNIICSQHLSIWEKFFSLAKKYSDLYTNSGLPPSFCDKVRCECVEAAVAQYNQEKQVDRLLGEMKAKLMQLNMGDDSAPAAQAIKSIVNFWVDVMADNQLKDHYDDFRLDGEGAAKTIQSWTDKAVVIANDYCKQIERIRNEKPA
jgi:hypothetical protein